MVGIENNVQNCEYNYYVIMYNIFLMFCLCNLDL